MEIRVIVNPLAAGGGAAAKSQQALSLLRAGGARVDMVETKRAGHGTELAQQAIRDGVSALLVVGGDGSLNEAVQAYLDPNGDPVIGPELGLIPAGTGGDFSRTVDLHGGVEQAVARVLSGVTRPVDLGVVGLTAEDGSPKRRAFLNTASAGITGLAARLANSGGKWMGGKLSFYVATTRATLGYSNVPLRVTVDGKEVHRGKVLMAVFANGRYFGGGMKIAPNAELAGGVLDCVLVGDVGRLQAVVNTPRLYSGDHLTLDKVTLFRGKSFRVEPWLTDSEVFVELDGETPGRLPMSVTLHPSAIRFRG